MARGVAIPEVREQLFAAADRVLTRDGPGALTTRAVTAEAGVANGVLHRHFRDLDEFLAAFTASRLAAIADGAATLPGRAGHGTVAGNLTEATAALFGASSQALMTLVATRPELGQAMAHDADGAGGLGGIEQQFAAYLDAEQELGRIRQDADTETLAFTLLGTAHHLVITRQDRTPDLHAQIARIVAVLIAGMDAGERSRLTVRAPAANCPAGAQTVPPTSS